jgi:hypothetical protein
MTSINVFIQPLLLFLFKFHHKQGLSAFSENYSAFLKTLNPKTAVGGVRSKQLRPDSLLLLAKWSVDSRYCLNPKGEFTG